MGLNLHRYTLTAQPCLAATRCWLRTICAHKHQGSSSARRAAEVLACYALRAALLCWAVVAACESVTVLTSRGG